MRKFAASVAVQPGVTALVEHGLGTTDVVVAVCARDGREVPALIIRYDADTVGITTDHRDEIRVVVIG